jgi:hypothetical protein
MRRATGIGADAFRSGGEVYLASNLRIKGVRLNVGDARGSSSAVAPGARSTPSSRQRRTTSLAPDADAVLLQHGRRDAYQKRRPARLSPNTPIRAFVVGLIDRPRADRCERLAPRDDDLFCDYGRHHLQRRPLVTILNHYDRAVGAGPALSRHSTWCMCRSVQKLQDNLQSLGASSAAAGGRCDPAGA